MDKNLTKKNDTTKDNSEDAKVKKSQPKKQNKKLNIHNSIQCLKQQKVNVSHQKTQEAKRKARDKNMKIKLIIVQKQVLQSRKRNRKSYILEMEEMLHAKSLKKALKNLKKWKANEGQLDIEGYIKKDDAPIKSCPNITNNDCFIVGERFIQNELLRSPDSFDVKSLEKGLNNQLNKVINATQNPPVVPNDNNEQDSDNQDNNENN